MMTMRNDDEILNTTTTTTDSSTIDNYYNNTNPIQMFINKLLLNVTTEAVINIATTTTPTTPMPMPTPTPMTNSQIPINQKNNQYLLNIINNLLLTTNTINTNNTDSDIKIDSIYGLRNIGDGAGTGANRATDSDINGNTQIIYAKLTAMIVLFFASLICGLIPLRLSKIIKWFNNKNNKNRKKLNKLMPVASAAATSASASSSSSSSAHRQTQSQSTTTMATTLSSSMESTTESSEMGIEEKSNQSIKDSLINYGGSGGSGAGGSNGHVRPKNQQNTDDADDDDDEEFSFNNSTGRSALIITMLFSFGGGVLLSTTFLHLLPEVIENIENLQHDGHLPEFNFPLAELLMCLGFFIMYLVEEIVHAYLHKHQTTSTSTMTTTSSDSTVNSSSTINNNNNNNNDLEQTSQLTESSHSHHPHHHHHHSHSSNTILTIETQKTDNSKDLTIDGSTPSSNNNNNILIEQNNNNTNTNTNTNANAHATNKSQSMIDCPVADSVSIMVGPVGPDEMLSSIPAGQHHHHGHSHLPKMHPDETMIVTSLRGLLIVLALSVHELFEGLAVGLETITETVWYMFGAVAAHKLILAFCVGIELIVTKTKLWLAIVYVFTFAVVSPIGIGIGILIENLNRNAFLNGGLTTTTTTIGPHDGHDHVSRLNSFDDDDVHDIGFDDDATITSNIASVILQGLASGTLLYVVFFEILQKGRSGLFQYFAVLAGFSIMFGLKFLIGHEHSHHEHEH